MLHSASPTFSNDQMQTSEEIDCRDLHPHVPGSASARLGRLFSAPESAWPLPIKPEDCGDCLDAPARPPARERDTPEQPWGTASPRPGKPPTPLPNLLQMRHALSAAAVVVDCLNVHSHRVDRVSHLSCPPLTFESHVAGQHSIVQITQSLSTYGSSQPNTDFCNTNSFL